MMSLRQYVRVPASADNNKDLEELLVTLEKQGHHVRGLAVALPAEQTPEICTTVTISLELCPNAVRFSMTLEEKFRVAANTTDFLRVQLLAQLPKTLPKIRILDLALENHLGVCAEAVVSAASQFGHLETLILDGNTVSDNFASECLSFAGLKSFHLRFPLPRAAFSGVAPNAITSLTLAYQDVSLVDLHRALVPFAATLRRLQLSLSIEELLSDGDVPSPILFSRLSFLHLRNHGEILPVLFDLRSPLETFHHLTWRREDGYNDSALFDTLRQLCAAQTPRKLRSVYVRIGEPMRRIMKTRHRCLNKETGKYYDLSDEETKWWGKIKGVKVVVERKDLTWPRFIASSASNARWQGRSPEED